MNTISRITENMLFSLLIAAFAGWTAFSVALERSPAGASSPMAEAVVASANS